MTNKARAVRTVLSDADPLRVETVGEHIERKKRERERAFADFIEQCSRDPVLLDRVLKALKPLRDSAASSTLRMAPMASGCTWAKSVLARSNAAATCAYFGAETESIELEMFASNSASIL